MTGRVYNKKNRLDGRKGGRILVEEQQKVLSYVYSGGDPSGSANKVDGGEMRGCCKLPM